MRKIFDGRALEDKRKVRSVRIPRNFTNQDQLDIEQYNDLQIKAKRKQEREYARLLKQMDEEESL